MTSFNNIYTDAKGLGSNPLLLKEAFLSHSTTTPNEDSGSSAITLQLHIR
jgi:hypothetical protein